MPNFITSAPKTWSVAVLPLLLVLNVSSAHSQTNLSAPSGWTKSLSGGNVVFSQAESGSRVVIQQLLPLNGGVSSWFQSQIERDARSRGRTVNRGKLTIRNGTYITGRNYQSSSAIYVGYAVGSQGRFMVYSAPTARTLQNEMPAVLQTSQQLMALDKSGGNRMATVPNGSKGGAKTSTSKTTTSSGRGNRGATTVVRKGRPVGTFQGVYLKESYTFGVGGMMIIQYEPILLVRGGLARRDAELPPQDVLTTGDKAANPKDWGRWTQSGDKIKVRWGDGDTDELKASYKSRPARPGERLNGSYSSLSGGGNTALGGDIMTFSSNSYTFMRDGRFAATRSGGGMSSSVTAVANSKNGGRYTLDGHTITFKFNDGRLIRRLFFFYPGKNEGNVLGIGDSAFVGDD